MDAAHDLRLAPVEALLLVADLLHRMTGNVFHPGECHRLRPPHLTGEDDKIGGAEGFNRDAGMRILGEEAVEDRIGDAVTDLVGMPLRHGLAREDIVVFPHRPLLSLRKMLEARHETNPGQRKVRPRPPFGNRQKSGRNPGGAIGHRPGAGARPSRKPQSRRQATRRRYRTPPMGVSVSGGAGRRVAGTADQEWSSATPSDFVSSNRRLRT